MHLFTKKTIAIIIVVIISISIFLVWHESKYYQIKGTYDGCMITQGWINIFFSDRDKVLCLHGNDYRIEELLQNHLEKGETYTFYGYTEMWYPTNWPNSECTPEKHYYLIEVRDECGTRIHGKYGYVFN